MATNMYIGDYIIYARVSSDKQESVRNQLMMAKSYAKKNIIGAQKGSLHESGSGRDLTKLESLTKLYEWVTSHPGCNVIVMEISRLGREMGSFDLVRNMAKVSTIHAINDNLVMGVQGSAIDYDRGLLLVQQSIMFSVNLSKRLKAVHLAKKQEGQEVRKVAPYGFKIVKIGEKPVRKYLVKNPNTFHRAQKIAKSRVIRRDYEISRREVLILKKDWAKNIKLAKIGERMQQTAASSTPDDVADLMKNWTIE
jgi:DNA invertase Pin-like site-specific DNA recombinase